MESSMLSIDSLGELTEIESLRDRLKQKDHIINEKSQIIDSLRQQVKDLVQDNEEMDNNQQLMQQKMDRTSRELEERNNDVESLSHTLKEIETAYDKLEKRMEARTGQVQKLAQDLVKAKKELEEAQLLNEELQHKNERLSAELEMANSRKRTLQDLRREDEEHQHHKQPQHVEYKPRALKFSSALRFPIADEIGEFMDSSSQLSTMLEPSSPPQQQLKACQYHSLKPNKASATITKEEPPRASTRVKRERPDIDFEPELARKAIAVAIPAGLDENADVEPRKPVFTRWMETPTDYKRKELTHEEEHAMRVARAQELARRNAKTKPLHQTSYALELDTFDMTNFNEQEIKRGNIRPPQRPPPQPPVSPMAANRVVGAGLTRRALANCSNTPPVVKRQVFKKAEAFIV